MMFTTLVSSWVSLNQSVHLLQYAFFRFGLTAALLAVLALGGNRPGDGSGQTGGEDDDEPGCCYGANKFCSKDQAAVKSKCMDLERKGCEWFSGEDADCTLVVEPGCCYGANSKCDVDDQATCEKNARRGGCKWLVGDAEDLCDVDIPPPGLLRYARRGQQERSQVPRPRRAERLREEDALEL